LFGGEITLKHGARHLPLLCLFEMAIASAKMNGLVTLRFFT
jgi:hypothetical protein